MFLRYSIQLPKERAILRYGQPREIVAKVGLTIEDQEFVRYLLWVDNSHILRSGPSPSQFTSDRCGRSLDIIALGPTSRRTTVSKRPLYRDRRIQEIGDNRLPTDVIWGSVK